MASDLRARLEQHEKNFEGLMALIPADLYYGKDNSDQWQRKKQTKEEKRAAKKAKLMPGAVKSALDVHRENELKRKREDEGEDAAHEQPEKSDTQHNESSVVEKPSKKRKVEDSKQAEDEKRKAKAAKKKEKREKKKAKEAKKKEKAQARKAKKQSDEQNSGQKGDPLENGGDEDEDLESAGENDQDDDNEVAEAEDMEQIDVDGLADNVVQENGAEWTDDSSVASTTDHDSPTFEEQSAASSSSSIQPPTEPEQKSDDPVVDSKTKQPKLALDTSHSQSKSIPEPADPQSNTGNEETKQDEALPKINHQSLVSRLESKIAAMRAARQADGLNGKSARTRTELIEARRIKETKRKQAKKDARAKQRADDAARNAVEEEAARLRGGEGSPLWSIPGLPSGSLHENFSFGTMLFEDGATTNADASDLRDAKKRKGPTDAKTQLSSLERKDARLAGLDDAKRHDIAEKDAWLNARRRIAGEKVKDSSSMLRKTLKRNEKIKSKSEKEWGDRVSGVQAAKEAKQRRRDDNLAKRREEKNAPRGKNAASKAAASSSSSKSGGKGKDRWGIKMNKGKPTGPAKKRPGFEGTFKIGGGRR